jgi:hypothetical protein
MRCRPTGWWAVVTGELFPAVRPGGLNASITCSSRTSTVVTQTMERNRRCQSPLRSHFGKCPNEVTVSHVRQCKRLCTATQRRSLSDWERFHQIARRRLGARTEGAAIHHRVSGLKQNGDAGDGRSGQFQYEYSDPLTAPDPVTMWIPADVPTRSAPAASRARTCSTVFTPPEAFTPIEAGTEFRR